MNNDMTSAIVHLTFRDGMGSGPNRQLVGERLDGLPTMRSGSDEE